MLNRRVGAETVGNYGGSTYGYDGFGNLTKKVVTKGSAPTLSVVVNKTTNRLATAGFLYDALGNLRKTLGGGLVMAYDGQNRVTRVTTASATEYYAYAGDNRRVSKICNYDLYIRSLMLLMMCFLFGCSPCGNEI